MTIVAHSYRYVIGVDTHAKTHTFAILAAATGALVDQAQFPTTGPGMTRALGWAARRTNHDPDTLWVIEGTGSYGALLTGRVTTTGRQVVEAAHMPKTSRHGAGKTDQLDARRIAAAVLPLDHTELRYPRADHGIRAALRILVTTRDHLTTQRTAAVNALTALLRTVDLGLDARTRLTPTQLRHITGWRPHPTDPLATATARTEATRLATHITNLDHELADNKTRITDLVHASPAAPLLNHTGIGPLTAAIALIAWSHPGRLRNEAAFAALAGVNPIPASSGNTTRHRLNHGGDRRLNQALHIAVITRMTHDPDTHTYVTRRTQEGRTTREIRRCLKRYLARHIYRTLNTTAKTTPATP